MRREDDSLLQGLGLVVSQGAFRTTLMASAVLMVSLALYWLMVKARGGALRVLGGVPVWRIQFEDLGKFLPAMLIGAVPVTAVALSYVALTRGAPYVPYSAQTLFWLVFIVIAITMSVAIAMSLTSWPSAAVLALAVQPCRACTKRRPSSRRPRSSS
ncbi:hypothetical protein [Allorhizocola rhizosphaerae]|uniref:hypothetical protein n=1 Tax=Allorhizocola rhizosphaerae TaxID=1872709 RepID=UPI000E3C71A7|nr:hypothetical protein [Allorhizocola rhizosphaerae]